MLMCGTTSRSQYCRCVATPGTYYLPWAHRFPRWWLSSTQLFSVLHAISQWDVITNPCLKCAYITLFTVIAHVQVTCNSHSLMEEKELLGHRLHQILSLCYLYIWLLHPAPIYSCAGGNFLSINYCMHNTSLHSWGSSLATSTVAWCFSYIIYTTSTFLACTNSWSYAYGCMHTRKTTYCVVVVMVSDVYMVAVVVHGGAAWWCSSMVVQHGGGIYSDCIILYIMCSQ